MPNPHHHNFDIEESPNPTGNKYLKCLRTNALTLATVAGVLLGGIIGFILRNTKDEWTERQVMYIGFIGKIFLQMLKSLIIPLIVSCLVSAIASLDLSLSGKVAARAIGYYLTTTFASVVLGMVVVVIIQPGVGRTVTSTHTSSVTERNTTTADTLLDLVRNMFPPNLIEACIFQHRTLLTPRSDNDTDVSMFSIGSETTQNTNILGLVVAAAAIGIALAQLGDETRIMSEFFHNLLTLMMKITSWIISISPVGVTFLVAGEILQMDDMKSVMGSLGLYFATVCVGLAIQGFVVLPLLYFCLTRRNPFNFIKCLGPAITTAFATASSTATLPLTIKCLEEKLGIDPRIARFTLPIGSAINMDGTALYEAVAAIFIAQVRGVDLHIGRLVAISITATAASIGAAGIPQAGLVTMVMVLDTLGLPAEDVTLILAVDWLLDRFRTSINVMGDAFGSGVVHYRSQKELQGFAAEGSRATSIANANDIDKESVNAHEKA
ncbi:excitatory amino acid transporter 3-like isoform X2 [Cylas formicarius]|nr:excitatory amino acid transporter 3-like isoform X2 [Cylas formicarius]XP_060520658.1 excitatory amino acid transporter 3-like isoform X2 [Cylas formicarius]XP_060520659.1 excitatory amino acid transporter 3-like isoform X2 [Cylas formicarius]